MLVRQISDECGWIYPWCILRRDKVSATAIRTGAKGMTSTVVTDALHKFLQCSGGDGWGPPLPERQRSMTEGD